jgi:DNA-binding LytR/AlgR family response regulator
MPTAIIADDEPLLRFHLQKSLAECWPELEILAQAANGDEAAALIQELSPDVAFLDIQMPGLNGLEVALKSNLVSERTQVVFLTAFDEYAVDAFESGAIDYLLKPLDEKRLMMTIKRLSQLIDTGKQRSPENINQLLQLVQAKQSAEHLQWLNVQKGEVIKVIHVEDVLALQAEDKYTTVVTTTGEYLIRMSIKQLEEQLDDNIFWRVHRSTLVNMKHIDRIEKLLNGQLQLYLNNVVKPIAVSRAKQHLFKAH